MIRAKSRIPKAILAVAIVAATIHAQAHQVSAAAPDGSVGGSPARVASDHPESQIRLLNVRSIER